MEEKREKSENFYNKQHVYYGLIKTRFLAERYQSRALLQYTTQTNFNKKHAAT